MKKENIMVLAQLLTAMKDAVSALEIAQRNNDDDKALMIKKEILSFQKKVEQLL